MIPVDKKVGGSQGFLANVAMLRGRQAEIEQAILAFVRATPDGPGHDDPERLRELRAVVAKVVDHGLEHIEQSEERHAGKHTAERVGRLLAGETADLGDLDYELQAWHVGVIGTGTGTGQAIHELVAGFDCRSLCVRNGEQALWAWFGVQHRLTADDLADGLPTTPSSGASLAIGEPMWGIDGFRLTHAQAQATLRVALHRPQRLTRYAEVALLASALQDDLLARWLVERYLAPLGEDRNGKMLRRTLHAYFAAERNTERAASELGLAPRTIKRRLRVVEEKLSRPISTCQAELEIALSLEQFDRSPSPTG